MPLKEAQKQVDDWISQYKEGYWSPFEILARLIEEVGELGREINHAYGHKKKKSTEDKKEMADEIGDVIFTLICLANSQKIDLDEAFQRVIDKCYSRDDKRFEKK
jgi:NTP pyrophosphatase (non-canonical NTP hydrolase)